MGHRFDNVKEVLKVIGSFALIIIVGWFSLKDSANRHYRFPPPSERIPGPVEYKEPAPDPIVLIDPVHRVYLYDVLVASQ